MFLDFIRSSLIFSQSGKMKFTVRFETPVQKPPIVNRSIHCATRTPILPLFSYATPIYNDLPLLLSVGVEPATSRFVVDRPTCCATLTCRFEHLFRFVYLEGNLSNLPIFLDLSNFVEIS